MTIAPIRYNLKSSSHEKATLVLPYRNTVKPFEMYIMVTAFTCIIFPTTTIGILAACPYQSISPGTIPEDLN